LDKDVDVLVKRYLDSPVTHAIGPVDEPVDTMDHHLLLVAPKEKAAITAEIANREGRTILFARTKHGVDRLAKQLVQAGVRAAGLHGGKSQGLRTRTLAEFREGTISVLVATDVAARGIHVDDVSLVMHVDPPADHKDYMHRRSGIKAHRIRLPQDASEQVRLTAAIATSVIPLDGPILPERARREGGGRGRHRGRRDSRSFGNPGARTTDNRKDNCRARSA